MACKSTTGLSTLDYKKTWNFCQSRTKPRYGAEASLTDKKYPSQKSKQED